MQKVYIPTISHKRSWHSCLRWWFWYHTVQVHGFFLVVILQFFAFQFLIISYGCAKLVHMCMTKLKFQFVSCQVESWKIDGIFHLHTELPTRGERSFRASYSWNEAQFCTQGFLDTFCCNTFWDYELTRCLLCWEICIETSKILGPVTKAYTHSSYYTWQTFFLTFFEKIKSFVHKTGPSKHMPRPDVFSMKCELKFSYISIKSRKLWNENAQTEMLGHGVNK